MKKILLNTQVNIVRDYINGMKYKEIMKKYGVNRWNIQAALSEFDILTNRIKSPPRLPEGKKKAKKKPIIYPEDFAHQEFYPKPKEDNPILLEDDVDFMERLDDTDGVDNLKRGFSEIEITEKNSVEYVYYD
ncbi:hypothetical protein CVT91_00070 [Candidatus Atribacteria bacterium HGW-Atribacteria-1]|nr:MAG: hypothetical protein CVT91_00070 [Candidatus Atribacteria bacterium HGW-Atribacteria-1]